MKKIYKATWKRGKEILDHYYSITKTMDDGLKLGELPIIIARRVIFYNLWTSVEKLVGKAAHSVLFGMGKPHGTSFATDLEKFTNYEQRDLDTTMEFLCNETYAIGWGAVEVELKNTTIEVRCKKGFSVGKEYVLRNKTSPVPVDSFFLGYFHGFFETYFKKRYLSEEITCVSMGDAMCTFLFEEM
ncbi:MAG: 4-vinyl reductase [Methanomicrobia archaeon]|nr:4-vinyl reductase [Methanomicrobia archaeon]